MGTPHSFVARLSLSLGLLLGCGTSSSSVVTATGTEVEPEVAKLFDNVIEEDALGLTLGRPVDPSADQSLVERARASDVTARVTIHTVTSNIGGTEGVYRVTFRSVGRIAGRISAPESFTIVLGKEHPSYSLVKHWDSRLVGKTVLGILKRIKAADGQYEFRGRFVADDDGHATAIRSGYSASDLH